MTHYSLEEWADFARVRASGETVALMQSHLDQGCAACSEVLKMWRSVLQVAGREAGFEAPASGVRCAKTMFHLARPERVESLPIRLARLVFSSFAEPLREGVRSSEASACHLLFEEGNWLLDLHVKPQAERHVVSLAGQILEREQSEPAYSGNTVAVMREKDELARTTTNEFGEFQLEFRPGGDLLLTVILEGKSVLVSALPGFTSGHSGIREARL